MHRKLLVFFFALLLARDLIAADFPDAILEATFKLTSPEADGTLDATCFFVRGEAPDLSLYLVTAAHVLEHIKENAATVVLRRPNADGSFDRVEYTIGLRHDGESLWVRNAKQDVAVLPVTEPLPVPVAGLPASKLAAAVNLRDAGLHICSPLFVFTFPKGFEANSSGFPVARQGIFASPPLLSAETYPTFYADFAAYAGDSGGPVFMSTSDGHVLVVGIVLGSALYHDTAKTEYEETVIQHPLGLGSILHAQYIRDTLAAAAKQKKSAAP